MHSRLAIVFFVALAAADARAGGSPLDLSLEPGAQVALGDPVAARVRSSQCVSLPASVVPVRVGAELRVRIWRQDYCEPVGAQDRSYPLPPLASGSYAVVLQGCAGNAPPGVDPCGEIERLPLVVTGTAAPTSVPTGSPVALAFLALGAFAVAAARMRTG